MGSTDPVFFCTFVMKKKVSSGKVKKPEQLPSEIKPSYRHQFSRLRSSSSVVEELQAAKRCTHTHAAHPNTTLPDASVCHLCFFSFIASLPKSDTWSGNI